MIARRACPLAPVLAMALVLTLASLAWGRNIAQDDAPSQPTFRSSYQQRIQAMSAGIVRPTFVGSASIAPRNGFPWMASIQVKGALRSVGHFCGGVAVDPGWILTAAHCVSFTPPGGQSVPVEAGQLQVLTRSNVLFAGGELRSVARVLLHDDYRVTERGAPVNDLALLQVEGPPDLVTLPLATPQQSDALLKDGIRLRIFGWGTASFEPDGAISNNLLYAFISVVGRVACNVLDAYAGLVDDTMFCAGLGYADACQGDSGGPANGYADGRMVLVGITSWGVGCNNKSYPGVYANVAKYRDWIGRTVGAKP